MYYHPATGPAFEVPRDLLSRFRILDDYFPILNDPFGVRPWTFVLSRNDNPRTGTLLDRPLRGSVICPDEMYNKMQLHPVSWVSTGACVITQLKHCFVQFNEKFEDWRPMYDDVHVLEEMLDVIVCDLYGVSAIAGSRDEKRSALEPYVDEVKKYIGPCKSLDAVVNHLFERGRLSGLREALSCIRGRKKIVVFLESFPLHFRVTGGKVYTRYPTTTLRLAPYETKGWREIGLTARVVAEFCRRHERPCIVMHLAHRAARFDPDGWESLSEKEKKLRPPFSINVWGDHMFTYEKDANTNLVHATRTEDEPPRKKLRAARERTVAFSDMTLFDEDSFTKAYDSCESVTLYSENLSGTQDWLRGKNYEFHPRYRSVNTVASLRVPLRKRKREVSDRTIVIKAVPARAEYLDKLCKAFESKTQLRLPYCGENLPSLVNRALNEFLYTRRQYIPLDVRERVAARGECALCGDKGKFDIDHIVPVCSGGGNDLDNLRLLCRQCHAEVTARTLASRTPVASVLSPSLLDWFSTKPYQLVWGDGSYDGLVALDVKGCRSNGLLESDSLPIYTIVDGPTTTGCWYDAHYLWVDTERDFSDDDAPYRGPEVYTRPEVGYMLDCGLISLCDIKAQARASRSLDPADLRRFFDTMRECVEASLSTFTVPTDWGEELEMREDASKPMKEIMLSLIGLWSGSREYQWRIFESNSPDDVPNYHKKVVTKGVTRYGYCTELVSNKSYLPLARWALGMEQLHMARLRRLCRSIGVVPRGAQVDCLYIREDDYDDSLTSSFFYKDGSPIYVKKSVTHRIPSNVQRRAPPRKLALSPDSFFAGDPSQSDDPAELRGGLERLADLIIEREGCLVLGQGGVGKSLLFSMVKQKILARGEKFYCMAITHAAARVIDGLTIAHFLQRYLTLESAWLFIDESSMISGPIWGSLAQYKLLGCRFVIAGDPDGQLPPVEDPLRCERPHEYSGFMRELVNDFRVRLTRNRRGSDPVLFRACSALYEIMSKPDQLFRTVSYLMSQYPFGGEVDVYACVSHAHRLLLNHMAMDKSGVKVGAHEDSRSTMAPQTLWLVKGMPLLGGLTEGKIRNCCRYTVADVGDSLKICDGAELIDVKLSDACRLLRPGYAVTYNALQGLTLSEKHIVLADVRHSHFTARHLNVGMSRATHGRFVHILSSREQRALLQRAEEAWVADYGAGDRGRGQAPP